MRRGRVRVETMMEHIPRSCAREGWTCHGEPSRAGDPRAEILDFSGLVTARSSVRAQSMSDERKTDEQARGATDAGYMVHGIKRRSSSTITRDWNTSWNRDTRTGKISFCTMATSTICTCCPFIQPTCDRRRCITSRRSRTCRCRSKCPCTPPGRCGDVEPVGGDSPIRTTKDGAILSASTSELHGKVQEIPQARRRPSTRDLRMRWRR